MSAKRQKNVVFIGEYVQIARAVFHRLGQLTRFDLIIWPSVCVSTRVLSIFVSLRFPLAHLLLACHFPSSPPPSSTTFVASPLDHRLHADASICVPMVTADDNDGARARVTKKMLSATRARAVRSLAHPLSAPFTRSHLRRRRR